MFHDSEYAAAGSAQLGVKSLVVREFISRTHEIRMHVSEYKDLGHMMINQTLKAQLSNPCNRDYALRSSNGHWCDLPCPRGPMSIF